jgi:hypothetical protein
VDKGKKSEEVVLLIGTEREEMGRVDGDEWHKYTKAKAAEQSKAKQAMPLLACWARGNANSDFVYFSSLI